MALKCLDLKDFYMYATPKIGQKRPHPPMANTLSVFKNKKLFKNQINLIFQLAPFLREHKIS